MESLIKQTAKTYNLESALFRNKVLKHWQSVAGSFVDEADSLTQAMDFKKGVLTVACLSREVATQIRLLADRIIYALNQLLGRQTVFVIRVEM